jgi:TadE-like protein
MTVLLEPWAPASRKLRRAQGQNLVELVLTMGFVVIFLLSGIEVGRAWHAYHVTRAAAFDGALTAAQSQSTAFGEAKIDERLAAVALPVVNRTVTPLNDGQTYQADVSVRFVPLFAGATATVPGALALAPIPGTFVIRFQSTQQPTTF